MVGFSTIGYHSARSGRVAWIWSSCKFARLPRFLLVFRRFLKVKSKIDYIVTEFGRGFRPIQEVQAAFDSRPVPDEALCAILWEYKDRGKKGYDLTELFFEMVRSRFQTLKIEGPERAGQDVLMKAVFSDYPNPTRPVDFVIRDKKSNEVLAIGLARYDSDRGGAQEDDRTGQYKTAIQEILRYSHSRNLRTKVVLLNDGPGLLLGSMWRDYVTLENSYRGEVLVLTLRMIPERLSLKWLQTKRNK